MKFAGFLLLISGWGIVLTALILLGAETAQMSFILAGTGVEALGLVLVIRSHAAMRRERRSR